MKTAITTSIDVNKIINVETLLDVVSKKGRQNKNCALFIGAGASYSSLPNEGVMLGGQVIELLKTLCYYKANRDDFSFRKLNDARLLASEKAADFNKFIAETEQFFTKNINAEYVNHLKKNSLINSK